MTSYVVILHADIQKTKLDLHEADCMGVQWGAQVRVRQMTVYCWTRILGLRDIPKSHTITVALIQYIIVPYACWSRSFTLQ